MSFDDWMIARGYRLYLMDANENTYAWMQGARFLPDAEVSALSGQYWSEINSQVIEPEPVPVAQKTFAQFLLENGYMPFHDNDTDADVWALYNRQLTVAEYDPLFLRYILENNIINPDPVGASYESRHWNGVPILGTYNALYNNPFDNNNAGFLPTGWAQIDPHEVLNPGFAYTSTAMIYSPVFGYMLPASVVRAEHKAFHAAMATSDFITNFADSGGLVLLLAGAGLSAALGPVVSDLFSAATTDFSAVAESSHSLMVEAQAAEHVAALAGDLDVAANAGVIADGAELVRDAALIEDSALMEERVISLSETFSDIADSAVADDATINVIDDSAVIENEVDVPLEEDEIVKPGDLPSSSPSSRPSGTAPSAFPNIPPWLTSAVGSVIRAAAAGASGSPSSVPRTLPWQSSSAVPGAPAYSVGAAMGVPIVPLAIGGAVVVAVLLSSRSGARG